jgi:hypothetical protein
VVSRTGRLLADPLGQADPGEDVEQFVVGGVRAPDQQVVPDRGVEQVVPLGTEHDLAAEGRFIELAQVDAAIPDMAGLGCQEAEQDRGDGALAGPARADQRRTASGCQLQVDVMNRR